MANLIMNGINLGPIIDVYQELPVTNINEHAIYRLYIRKFDMFDGHGKDNETCPVGYYKPAEGSRWTGSQVERGSYGQYMDGYYDCPVSRMRRGTPNANWDPVHCTKEEGSGIWYYDYEKDDVFFAWNSVGYGGVNPYTIEMLDKKLGTYIEGYYVYSNDKWNKLNHEYDVMLPANRTSKGQRGLTPKPVASTAPRVLVQSAEWLTFNVIEESDEPFTVAIGRSVSNVFDGASGYIYRTNIDLTIYNRCKAVIEWSIVRETDDTLKFSETAYEFSGATMYRAATITNTDAIITAEIVTEGRSACEAKSWTCLNEHYNNVYMTNPYSYTVFGDDSGDYIIKDSGYLHHSKIEYDHAARFIIDGNEVYGNLNSKFSYVEGVFTVVQEMTGTIDGKIRADDSANGHYMRIGRCSFVGPLKLSEAMDLVVWGEWHDIKNLDFCTIYLTKEEYDSITPDPNIIYTITD